MTKKERLIHIANLYVSASKRLKTIDKKMFPETYKKCSETIITCELILMKHGVKITL